MPSDLTGTITIKRRSTNRFMGYPGNPSHEGIRSGNPPASKTEPSIGQNLHLMKPAPAASNPNMRKAATSK